MQGACACMSSFRLYWPEETELSRIRPTPRGQCLSAPSSRGPNESNLSHSRAHSTTAHTSSISASCWYFMTATFRLTPRSSVLSSSTSAM